VSDSEDAELLQVFLEEAREHLDGIEGDLLALESAATLDVNLVNKIFRAAHSVKGGAGFFGLDAIKTLSHSMENVLGLMQKGRLAPTRDVTSVLLKSADRLVNLISCPTSIESADTRELSEELEKIVECVLNDENNLNSSDGVLSTDIANGQTAFGEQTDDSISEHFPNSTTPKETNGSLPHENSAKLANHTPDATTANAPASRAIQNVATETSIRVHVGILDRLMTLAGELVLTRNQLLQSHETNNASNAEATQRIDHITTELQDAIMSTRMQSIGIVFQKFRRVVRDLASHLGKEVDLVLEGEDVELDRSIIEAVGDPLTHLVRNALDHGLERPNQRIAMHKPRIGTLRLSAFHKAGQVIIEIADDGAGIDPQRIRAKAIEKGICSVEQLANMTEAAIIKLIFRPGFSTATEVTEVSGRGVGMDVVHSNLSRLGGVVDVQSTVGSGTIMRIKLPLTLAIIPCLLVTEEGESFAIPQANLVELHRLPAREVKNQIQKFGDVLVLRLRGDLIPLVRLRDALAMPTRTFTVEPGIRIDDFRKTGFDRRQDSSHDEPYRRTNDDRRLSALSAVNIAIVASGEFRYGIMVESLQDSLEIVVKPLGRHLRNCDSYAGATILGDGRLALILDVVSIARRLQSADTGDALDSARHAAQKANESKEKITVLLVENSGQEQLAIPLGLIERIEHISISEIQTVGGKRTLTYRNKSLPLLSVEDVVAVAPCRMKPGLYAIIYRSHHREVGLVVSDLIDIVDSDAEVDELTHRQNGVFGSFLIDRTVTLLLDIHSIARQKLGTLEQTESSASHKKQTVLIVEDSKFFRDRLTEFHQDAGYNVITATDGLEGLTLLNQNADRIDLVITDIEMPNLDGFGFTKKLRNDPRFSKLPVIAVTSLMGEEAELRGKQVGITEYLIKLDRERIMGRVAALLEEKTTLSRWSAA
jgi:two-component system chemotaxis sensor kinase CheA